MTCTRCAGVEQQFDQAEAAKALRRFRRRGPDRTTRLLIDALRAALTASDAREAVLLDIGAGVGAIHHELLDGPIAHATHIDASPAHIAAAREEAERRRHHGRVAFVGGDFVAIAETVGGADVVTLDRVICCYYDMPGLVSQAASKAGRFFGAVYPRRTMWTRLGVRIINLFQRVKRSAFRVYLHDPSLIDAALRDADLERSYGRTTFGWEVVVYTRVGESPTSGRESPHRESSVL